MNTIQEVAPSRLLQTYVRFYHYSVTRVENTALYKPLPARPEQFLQFSFRDHYTVIDRTSGARATAPPVVVVGRQAQRNVDLLASGVVVTFTIHFQPTGFYRLFHVPLRELTNLTPDAVDVVGPEIMILYEQLHQAGSLHEMVRLVESFLLRKMGCRRPFHPVQTAAAALLDHHGMLNLAELVSSSNLSRRQFERTFVEQVGVPPKLFSRIVRFTHALERKYREPHRSWTDIAYEAGYYDQMHLIHDCRAFTEETPSTLLQTWVPCQG